MKLNNVQLPQRRKKKSMIIELKTNNLKQEISLSLVEATDLLYSTLSFKNKKNEIVEIIRTENGYEAGTTKKNILEVFDKFTTFSSVKKYIKENYKQN